MPFPTRKNSRLDAPIYLLKAVARDSNPVAATKYGPLVRWVLWFPTASTRSRLVAPRLLLLVC